MGPRLAAGDTSAGLATVTVPAATPRGAYYLLACADDLAPKVTESNESNNCAASATAVRVTP